jgi:hypothetical protein
MKKVVLAAVVLAAVTAFTGASAAPAAAPSDEARAGHTLRWKLKEIASHQLGRHFVGADTIRSVRTGDIVGYDSITGKFFPRTSKARIDVAASLRGGILVARVRADFDSGDDVFRGPVLKGTGKFQGAEGTISAKPIGDGSRTLITVHYHV